MAQIEQSDGGKKKKGGQKKMHIHVDFTPMVDMNMLLITFFMLCTTMIKSQTLNIFLPAPNDTEQPQNAEKINAKDAFSMILDTQLDEDGNSVNVIYFYEGQEPILDADGNFVDAESKAVIANPIKRELFIDGEDVQAGIRAVLHKRNEQVIEQIDKVKERWRNHELTDRQFDSIAKIIRTDANLSRPKVNIMTTNEALWESVIAALDEMQINQISQYRLATMKPVDSVMIARFQPIEEQ